MNINRSVADSLIPVPVQPLAFLAGGGSMGGRIRALDWSTTPLGRPETWPESLRASLGICLNTEFPIAIYFGAEATLLYNDAWHPILGDKHPWALGRSGRVVWSEIWDVVGPVFERVMAAGEGSFFKDALLSMHRFGYTEECYFDYTFSTIGGQSAAFEGVFNAVNETSFHVLGDRRGNRCCANSPRASPRPSRRSRPAHLAVSALESDPADIPFALFYLLDRTESRGANCGRAGFREGAPGGARGNRSGPEWRPTLAARHGRADGKAPAGRGPGRGSWSHERRSVAGPAARSAGRAGVGHRAQRNRGGAGAGREPAPRPG